MAIHLVQRSIALKACQKVAASNDIIVLLGEGVAALGGSSAALGGSSATLGGSSAESSEQNRPENLHATTEDINQRGLAGRVSDGVTLISDSQLVSLCAEHSPVVSWNQP